MGKKQHGAKGGATWNGGHGVYREAGVAAGGGAIGKAEPERGAWVVRKREGPTPKPSAVCLVLNKEWTSHIDIRTTNPSREL